MEKRSTFGMCHELVRVDALAGPHYTLTGLFLTADRADIVGEAHVNIVWMQPRQIDSDMVCLVVFGFIDRWSELISIRAAKHSRFAPERFTHTLDDFIHLMS